MKKDDMFLIETMNRKGKVVSKNLCFGSELKDNLLNLFEDGTFETAPKAMIKYISDRDSVFIGYWFVFTTEFEQNHGKRFALSDCDAAVVSEWNPFDENGTDLPSSHLTGGKIDARYVIHKISKLVTVDEKNDAVDDADWEASQGNDL
jgi:hypothetical protein